MHRNLAIQRFMTAPLRDESEKEVFTTSNAASLCNFMYGSHFTTDTITDTPTTTLYGL